MEHWSIKYLGQPEGYFRHQIWEYFNKQNIPYIHKRFYNWMTIQTNFHISSDNKIYVTGETDQIHTNVKIIKPGLNFRIETPYLERPSLYWNRTLFSVRYRSERIWEDPEGAESGTGTRVEAVGVCTLQWRHNGRDGVSNHQPYDCLLNPLFKGISQKTSKLRVAGLCVGNSPVTGEFFAQRTSNAENVSIWWRHHDNTLLHLIFLWDSFWYRYWHGDSCDRNGYNVYVTQCNYLFENICTKRSYFRKWYSITSDKIGLAYIKNNAWVTVNNNFFCSRVKWFANDFHEWRSHEGKSLAYHITSDQKIVIHGNECIILFLTCYFMFWTYNSAINNHRWLIAPLSLRKCPALWRHHNWSVTSRERELLALWRHFRRLFLHAQIGTKAIFTSE